MKLFDSVEDENKEDVEAGEKEKKSCCMPGDGYGPKPVVEHINRRLAIATIVLVIIAFGAMLLAELM